MGAATQGSNGATSREKALYEGRFSDVKKKYGLTGRLGHRPVIGGGVSAADHEKHCQQNTRTPHVAMLARSCAAANEIPPWPGVRLLTDRQ